MTSISEVRGLVAGHGNIALRVAVFSFMIARSALLLGSILGLSAVCLNAGAVEAKVDLLQVIKAGGVTSFLNEKQTLHDPPEKIWTFTDDGQLKVSGRGFGYLATKESYGDYHLVIDYKFTGLTLGTREGKARDNGILVHGHGPDGAYGGTWMSSIEAQIIEGGTGDILVLSGKTADGADVLTSLSAEFEIDANKQMRWKKGAPRQTVTKGRVNWAKRDIAWKDEAGFRGKDDVQSRYNEWTRMEVIAKGDTLQYFVNGVLVNEAADCKPSQGKICLQTEGAEMLVKRFELHPLGAFKEVWNPVMASGGTDVAVKASRETSWSPEESQKAIQIDGPYEVQLVACEPLVRDPVEVTWDAKGRCFVADMIDYPLGGGPGKPPLSRIQLLTDPDANGRYTKAITFAEHMDNVQGLLPYKDGLIATTRTQILFLRDTNGDGVADEIKPLVEGFNPNHAQLQVSAPRWGLDNCVYFNNGLDTKEIYPAGHPNEKQNLTRCNLRWDPATGKLEPATGFGQFGGCFDDWGRHFFCSNRNPVMFAVMPYEAVIRNPHAGITQGWEDIAPTGAEAKVYPLQLTHTTADAHAGTHTAACGLGVYRGDLMPELRGEIFVSEPTAQCVVRYHPEPKGASLKATRVGDHKEFFATRDEWSRPVNVTTGPDGALYVCDMYRRYIDHARFFPEEFVKTHDMRAGENEGRIWRVVPKGGKARAIEPAPQKMEELVAWLGHKNAWQRETAQRLLVEMKASGQQVFNGVPSGPVSELMALHFLFTVQGSDPTWEALNVEQGKAAAIEKVMKDPRIQALRVARRAPVKAGIINGAAEAAIESNDARYVMQGILATSVGTRPEDLKLVIEGALRFPDDIWIQKSVLAASSNHAGKVAAAMASAHTFTEGASATRSDFLRALASSAAADGAETDVGAVLATLGVEKGKLLWWKPALLQGLSEGLPKSGGKLGVKSLAELTAKPPAAYKEAAAEIASLLAEVDKVLVDPAAPMDQRLACLPLLAQRKWEQAEPIIRGLLADGQPVELSNAALAFLKKFPADKTAPLLYELLPKLAPAERLDVVKTLTSSAKTVKDFFERIDRGEVPKAFVDAETRWRYLRPNNPLYSLAEKIFGKPSADRAAVITDYEAALKMKGDATKGHQIFSTVCIACHRLKGEGVDVAPDITDVRIKEKEALLSDILDPNRMVEARWMAYQIDTKDGRTIGGLIAGETTTEVTMKMAGGITDVVPRSNIKSMKCLDQSLMPVGLEAGITKEQMADLLAFLKGE